jgi:hypothetical protein
VPSVPSTRTDHRQYAPRANLTTACKTANATVRVTLDVGRARSLTFYDSNKNNNNNDVIVTNRLSSIQRAPPTARPALLTDQSATLERAMRCTLRNHPPPQTRPRDALVSYIARNSLVWLECVNISHWRSVARCYSNSVCCIQPVPRSVRRVPTHRQQPRPCAQQACATSTPATLSTPMDRALVITL